MSIPEEVWNAAWQGNWEDDEGTIYRILEKPPVDAPAIRGARRRGTFVKLRCRGEITTDEFGRCRFHARKCVHALQSSTTRLEPAIRLELSDARRYS